MGEEDEVGGRRWRLKGRNVACMQATAPVVAYAESVGGHQDPNKHGSCVDQVRNLQIVRLFWLL